MKPLRMMVAAVAMIALTGLPANLRAAPAMVEKNLFHPERKPVEPKQYPTTPRTKRRRTDLSKRLQLDAIFYYDDVKTALIRLRSRGFGAGKTKRRSPYMRVREKDTIGDYKVVAIYPKSIVVEGYGEKFTIPLFQKGKISPPPATLPKTRAMPQANPTKTKVNSKTKLQKQPARPPTPTQVDEKLRRLQAFQEQIRSQGRTGNIAVPPGMKATEVKETLEQLKQAIESIQQKKP